MPWFNLTPCNVVVSLTWMKVCILWYVYLFNKKSNKSKPEYHVNYLAYSLYNAIYGIANSFVDKKIYG